jgi:hypothetical protein
MGVLFVLLVFWACRRLDVEVAVAIERGWLDFEPQFGRGGRAKRLDLEVAVWQRVGALEDPAHGAGIEAAVFSDGGPR